MNEYKRALTDAIARVEELTVIGPATAAGVQQHILSILHDLAAPTYADALRERLEALVEAVGEVVPTWPDPTMTLHHAPPVFTMDCSRKRWLELFDTLERAQLVLGHADA